MHSRHTLTGTGTFRFFLEVNRSICTCSAVYLSTPAKDAVTAVDRLSTCVTDINDWMTASRLRLNPTKTQVMWLGSSEQLGKIVVREMPLLSTRVTVVDLGVVLDRQLSLDAHMSRLSVGAETIN